MGPDGLATVLRVGRLTSEGFDALEGRGGPVARTESVVALGVGPCPLQPGIPAEANVTSVRNAPPLLGLGLIDSIPEDAIRRGAEAQGDGVHGRPSLSASPDGSARIGRFGWKAAVPTLEQFVAEAFRNEHGITSPLAPTDLHPPPSQGTPRCAGDSDQVEDDGRLVQAVTAFVASLAAPQPINGGEAGAAVFRRLGCVACHTPSLPSDSGDLWLYSDLLVHDVGPALDDSMPQGDVGGREWRTTPLWGLGSRPRLLHDGRARTIPAAIMAHDGEAAQAVAQFRSLSPEERTQLMAFLASL